MLVLGPIELGVLSGKEDLPSGHAGFLGYLEMHLFLACPWTSPAYVTGSFDSYVDTSRDYPLGSQSPPRGLSLEMFLSVKVEC